MKKPTRKAITCIVVMLCVVVIFVAILVLRARIYYGSVPVFMGHPTMQKLLYHDTDIVMLPGELDTVVYNGNTYVGVSDIDWHFDADKMQCAGKIHHRKILHFYSNYNVYVSANAVTEQGIPIFLYRHGEPPPFYYVLEGYEAPDLMTSDLYFVVDREWRLPYTAKLSDVVDIEGVIPYNDEIKEICAATLISAEYDFMARNCGVYQYGEQYYWHLGLDTFYPITSEDLLDLLRHVEVN